MMGLLLLGRVKIRDGNEPSRNLKFHSHSLILGTLGLLLVECG